jgi:signal transduction histidine kinase
VTVSALALTGWLAALTATGVVVGMRRARAGRAERVARAVHELRGGICAVAYGVHLAARLGELSSARARALALELGRAELALDDLDGYSRPRAAEHVDVRQLVRDSVEASRGAAAARGVELELRWTGPEAFVLGNRIRLAQATANLIGNAIEHGGGEVEVRGRGDGRAVRLEVVDSGTGLPAPVAELARRKRRGRRGRGLAIASDVARAHGGRLAAAPSERGAKLVLELPAAQRPLPQIHGA